MKRAARSMPPADNNFSHEQISTHKSTRCGCRRDERSRTEGRVSLVINCACSGVFEGFPIASVMTNVVDE